MKSNSIKGGSCNDGWVGDKSAFILEIYFFINSVIEGLLVGILNSATSEVANVHFHLRFNIIAIIILDLGI